MTTAQIQQELRSKHDNLKLKAVSSEFRRLLLGLIYTDSPIFQSEILKHIEVDSNALAYHLNRLCEAGLVEKTYERHGRNFAKYSIKKEGEKFLEFIGAKEKLNQISTNKSGQQRHINLAKSN